MEKRREYDALALAAAAVAAEDDDVVLPGFRFHPTDEELVGFYLRRKVEKRPLCIEIIKEFDIYRQDPWDLPKAITAGENEWYFFCLRGRKYRNSIRPNRVTQSGFWKATGIDRPIHSPANSGACVGLKKSLVYYRGSAGKGTKTDWMMHEFRLPSPTTVQEAEVWTICRIFRRSVSYKRQPNSQTQFISHPMAAAHKSSSITSCFETEKGREHRGSATSSASSSCYPNGANYNGEVGLVADYYCAEDQNVWMLCGGEWSAIGQAPLTSPAPCIAAQTPSICDLFVDSDWNELAGIVEFMADSSLPCNER